MPNRAERLETAITALKSSLSSVQREQLATVLRILFEPYGELDASPQTPGADPSRAETV